MLTKRIVILAAVGAALIAGSVVGGNSYRSRLAVANALAEQARDVAARSVREASNAMVIAATYEQQAAVADLQRKQALARADAADRNVKRLATLFDSAVKTAPDTCQPVIEAAAAVMAQQDSEITSLRTGLQAADSSKGLVQHALDSTTVALTRLQSATTNLVHADAIMSKRSRPSFLSRITPRPGFGAAIGFDGTGVPRVIVGFTFGWSL